MDHDGLCSFCLDPVPSTNAIIHGDDKKIYKDIFDCSKSFLWEEISRRDSFDWNQSEGLLSPFCALCFKTAHKIHLLYQELKSVQEKLNELVINFKAEVKGRASKNADEISVNVKIGDNEDDIDIKEEVDEFEQSEVDSFHEDAEDFYISQSEEEFVEFENSPNNIFQPIDKHINTAKISGDLELVNTDKPNLATSLYETPKIVERNEQSSTDTFKNAEYENRTEQNRNETVASAVQWPHVVLERIKFDANGKVLTPCLKRGNTSSCLNAVIERNEQPSTDFFENAEYENRTEHNGTTASAIQWPRVVLERLKFDTNGKVLTPCLKRKRANTNSGLKKRVATIKADAKLKTTIKSLNSKDSKSTLVQTEKSSQNLFRPILPVQPNSTPLATNSLFYILVENKPEVDGFFCDICGKPFDEERLVTRHRLSHNAHHEKPFNCPTCGKRFNYQRHAESHADKCTSDKNTYKCKICGKSYYTVRTLRDHLLESHREDLPFGCEQCGRRFKFIRTLNKHKYIHEGKVYTCELCSKNFKSKLYLRKHKTLLHADHEKIACKVCGKKYRKEYISIHEACHGSTIKCPVCKKIYKNKQGLQTHMKYHGEKPFSCKTCDKNFPTQTSLRTHFLQVHDTKECKCQTCGKIFKNNICLIYHVSKVHSQQSNVHSCEICGKQMKGNSSKLKRHIDEVHGKNRRFTCATCGKSFGNISNLKRHEELHKTEEERTKFKCDICGDKYFPQMVQLVGHQKQFHTAFTNGPLTCNKCENKFDDSSALFLHNRKLATNLRCKCSFCKELFYNRCDLLIHSAKNHPLEDLLYECKTCKIVFNSVPSLKKHASSKHGIKMTVRRNPIAKHYEKNDGEVSHQCEVCGRIKKDANSLTVHKYYCNAKSKFKYRKRDLVDCDVCGKKFRKNYIKGHMEREHSGKIFVCSVCGNSFGCRDNLLRHEKNCREGRRRTTAFQCKLEGKKINRKTYKCDFCDKLFFTSGRLSEHARTHTGEKPFSCEFCGKCFGAMGNFKVHLRIHKGERPFTCDVCGISFSQRSNLKRHNVSHTGERPHKCTFCDKAFTTDAILKTHLRLHTGEKPYSCSICAKAFSDRSIWYKHRKTHK